MNDQTDVPRVLAGWQSRKGFNQEAAAAVLGVSQPTYSRWMTGATQPSAAAMRRILKIIEQTNDASWAPFLEGVRNATHMMLAVDATGYVRAASRGVVAAFGGDGVLDRKLGEICALESKGICDHPLELINRVARSMTVSLTCGTVFSPDPMHVTCSATEVAEETLLLVSIEPTVHRLFVVGE